MNPLGLTAREEQVYRYLAANPRTPLETLIGCLGDEAADIVAILRGVGIVIGNPPDVRPPCEVFRQRIRDQEALLFSTRARVAELQEVYDRAGRAGTRGPVTTLSSRMQVQNAMDDLELGAERCLMKFITAPYVELTSIDPPDDPRRIADDGTLRTPQRRVLYEQAVMDDPKALNGIRATLALPNAEIRVTASLPYKLIIQDEERALLPAYAPGHDDLVSAHLITAGNELTAHMLVFAQFWSAATPLSANADSFTDGLSIEEVQILQLLVGGTTNEAIARLLDTSVRTVARRLSDLQKRAGVTSRAALIRHAAMQWMR